MKRSLPVLKYALLILPLFLGLIGLVEAGEPFLDALFYSISMYAMGFTDTPPNLWVEVGRWLAPLATASGVLLAVIAIRDRIRAYLCYCRGNSVAVYGAESDKTALLDRLGRRGIDGGDRFVRAHRYILLGGDGMDFIVQNRKKLEGREVYLRCSDLPAQAVSDPHLRLFCPEEIAARLFWKKRNLYALSAARGHQLSIVFLGFGRLGENLLTYGLQDNIFSPDQKITYHIFGADGQYAATHTQLDRIEDPVVFWDEPWYAQLSQLENADLILVLEQDGQLSLLQNLLLATTRPRFHVFTAGNAGIDLLEGQNRLELIPWRDEAQSPEYIFSDVLYHRAKRINLRYAHLYGGVEENERTLEEQWAMLDAFTRYSNISAADYHEMCRAMLGTMGVAAEESALSPELLELLAELEHIRWCRYHYLNNWRRGTPENGKRKDAARRIHADLIPYRELTDSEKEKDRENIRVLLSIS